MYWLKFGIFIGRTHSGIQSATGRRYIRGGVSLCDSGWYQLATYKDILPCPINTIKVQLLSLILALMIRTK